MIVALALCGLSPQEPVFTEGPGGAEPVEQSGAPTLAPIDDYLEQAPLDVETLITDSSKAYLHARARLEEHPSIAAEAILDRLSTVPPPTSTDRKRLFDVMAVLGLPDYVDLFAQELRRELRRDESSAGQTKALEQWLPLLAEQGAAAAASLTQLVADQALSTPTRAQLLDALVEVTPLVEIASLVGLVGRGARPLRQQLHRSLQRRASREPDTRQALRQATDAALADADVKRRPALLLLRSALTSEDDTAFFSAMRSLAQDPGGGFAIQAAALQALSRRDAPTAHEALTEVAQYALSPAQRGTQRAEVLAWLALLGLPPTKAAPLITHYRLIHDDAPRLATLGFTHSTLPADQSWLPPALENPWPQVRQAAIDRVQPPCTASTVKLLEQKGHLAGRRSEDDRAVARAAIGALGRCGATSRLIKLLEDEELDMELRSEAGRQLARRGEEAGIAAIAGVLRRNPSRAFARRLARALRHLPRPTPAADAVLCEVSARADEAGHAARETLRSLHRDPQTVCVD